MSEIDQYRHKLLGLFECPSDYPAAVVYRSSSPLRIAVSELEEAVHSWAAKPGDLIVGGGSGECPAFRIALPEARRFLRGEEVPNLASMSEICHAYWSPNEAFALCTGFLKIGWSLDQDLELWLMEFVLTALEAGKLRVSDNEA